MENMGHLCNTTPREIHISWQVVCRLLFFLSLRAGDGASDPGASHMAFAFGVCAGRILRAQNHVQL